MGGRFSIRLRNSHDTSMTPGLTDGYRVFVCENMAFSGDFEPVLAKHSKNFSQVPRHLARSVHDHYFNPQYEEFQARTMWSLSNAFKSAFKQLDPIPQFKASAKLAGFLEAARLSVAVANASSQLGPFSIGPSCFAAQTRRADFTVESSIVDNPLILLTLYLARAILTLSEVLPFAEAPSLDSSQNQSPSIET